MQYVDMLSQEKTLNLTRCCDMRSFVNTAITFQIESKALVKLVKPISTITQMVLRWIWVNSDSPFYYINDH